MPEAIKQNSICYHCGEASSSDLICDDKDFCSKSCLAVYKLLSKNNLSSYYSIEKNPGIHLKELATGIKFNFLDDVKIREKFIEFSNEEITKVSLYIPSIHCSSCIYLLENLYKIHPAILISKCDFIQKKLSITYKTKEISLKDIVELLYSAGYEPDISNPGIKDKTKPEILKKLYYKIGIAGFCFANIMLFSFPEYFSSGTLENDFRNIFQYLNIILAIPVFFYSASDYFKTAYNEIKIRHINLEFPIALGISVIFLRSIYEILTHTGAGYFDSLTGLIFFLLIGKLVQTKTFDSLNFERDFRSYFPLSIIKLENGIENTIPISDLKKGDRIMVRYKELIPADSIVFKGTGFIDYSFVTGESALSEKGLGEIIYAGGRHEGSRIELEVYRDVSQSYLTQLWNNDIFKKAEVKNIKINDVIAKYFTLGTVSVALIAGAFWFRTDPGIAINVFTSVLIVACPCALALAGPFALSNTLRIFGKNKFYLKNTSVVEMLSTVNSIVFDKTGTITKAGDSEINYFGSMLTNIELIEIKSVVRNSTHPLSRKIYNSIKAADETETVSFIEHEGLGISGKIGKNEYMIGSFNYIFKTGTYEHDPKSSKVYVSKNGELKGNFLITNYLRNGLKGTIDSVSGINSLSILSGDNNKDESYLRTVFGKETEMKFLQKPEDKLNYIKKLQSENKKVLMIGDGLNDAGALKQSDAGVSITENISCFSPACDAILDAESLRDLNKFLKFSKTTINIIKASFIFSMVYNFVGLSFAVQGKLSPIIAAILMPVSSVSVVLFAVLLTWYYGKKNKLI
ncbi:heavy metal translocating P-type ATPase metal-binding domain-containing protein [soil metagenome]